MTGFCWRMEWIKFYISVKLPKKNLNVFAGKAQYRAFVGREAKFRGVE